MKLMHLGNRRLLDTVDRVVNSCLVLVGLLLIVPMSTMGAAELPDAKPAALADLFKSNPEAAFKLVIDQLNQLQAAHAGGGGTKWGWIIGGAAIILGIARMIPGPAGAVANWAWALLAPRMHKDEEAKRDVMANGFLEVAAIMRSFPADSKLGDVLAKLNSHLPEPVKQAYRDWEKTQGGDRPPTKAEIIEGERLKALASSAPTA